LKFKSIFWFITIFYGVVLNVPMIFSGITNPDLSAIGQVFGGYTDDSKSINPNEPTLNLGEAEIVLDAYLNPYFKGWLTLSGSEDGVSLEEAYTSMVKGLPYGLAMKAGKYRLGFGKINTSHPHAYPFIAPPRSLVSLLPGGDGGFNETGVQVSEFLPTPGDWASTLSLDLIEGKEFHPNQKWTRLGGLGHWSNDFLLGETGALETGLSLATGNDFTQDQSRVFIYGLDLKAKFFLPGSSQLIFQAEAVLNQGHAIDSTSAQFQQNKSDELQPFVDQNRMGFVALIDYHFKTQYNGGLLFEQWDEATTQIETNRAVRGFLGYAVLEESTLLRLSLEHFMPESGEAINTLALQLIFSMGPHKAHQF